MTNSSRLVQVSSRPLRSSEGSRGSALLTAIFVIVLLTGMALILLFVSQTEVKMTRADSWAKQAFYLAEAATQHGREQLRLNMVAEETGALGPRLTAAAGANTDIDFNVGNVRPQFTGDTLTGFTGTGDDVPIIGITPIDGGWYAAFLTNDPADGEDDPIDTNNFVMLTGLGVRPNGSFEVAQTIVQPGVMFPTIPATITLLGPTPDFDHKSGKGWMDVECPEVPKSPYLAQTIKGSKLSVDGVLVKHSKIYKAYQGTDCAPYRKLGPVVTVSGNKYATLEQTGGGGIPGLFMPTYGVVGGAAETEVEDNMSGSKIDYLSNLSTRTQIIRPAVPVGGVQGEDTIADLTDATEPTVIGSGLGALDATWTNCSAVRAIVEKLRDDADYLCTPPGCTLPGTSPSTISFIAGDFRVPCGSENWGLLVVTGALDFPASASWHGIVLVIGEGKFYRVKKDGYGNISGGVVVADIAGPDDAYGNGDDCTGGTGGFAQVTFEEFKKAKGTTSYCSDDIAAADPGYHEPPGRVSFRQR